MAVFSLGEHVSGIASCTLSESWKGVLVTRVEQIILHYILKGSKQCGGMRWSQACHENTLKDFLRTSIKVILLWFQSLQAVWSWIKTSMLG